MEKILEQLFEPYYKQNNNGLDEWVEYSDALKVAQQYALQQQIALLGDLEFNPRENVVEFAERLRKKYDELNEQLKALTP